MKRFWVILLALLLFAGAAAEENDGVIAKVTTEKGPLWLRADRSAWSRGIDQIPNGTCLLVTEEAPDWCRVDWNGKTGFCSTAYLTFLREADRQLLSYRVLRPGDTGEDVLALKARLQELGYIRAGAEITDYYNDILKERVILFQRETGMTENGVASQELQMYLYSDQAPVCTQTLPKARGTAKAERQSVNRVICGCCWGEGCECCNNTGWIYY